MLPFSTKNGRGLRCCTPQRRTRSQPDHRSRRQPQNTLADYDPGLVKKIHAFGPLFSDAIPRTNTEAPRPHDFVEDLQVPDGTKVRVLVKAPSTANPAKILKVAPSPQAKRPTTTSPAQSLRPSPAATPSLSFPKPPTTF